MQKVFKSRVSILLSIVIWPSLLVPLIIIGKMLILDHNKEALPPFIILSFSIVLVAFIWNGIRYVIDDNKFIIKMFWIKKSVVEINDIIKIESSYCLLSAPALSLRRLKCKLKKGSKYPFLLISPEDEEEFINLLFKINPAIETELKPKGGNIWDWDF
jgi:hypothetical protein